MRTTVIAALVVATLATALHGTKRFFQWSVFTLTFDECPRLARGMLTFLATHGTHATLHTFLPRFARGGFAAAGEAGETRRPACV